MTWSLQPELATQRIADLHRDARRAQAVRASRRRRRSRRAGGLARLLWPAAGGRLAAGGRRLAGRARAALDTLGLILSPSWPTGPDGTRNPARPSPGR